MKLTSQSLLDLIDLGLVRKIASFLADTLIEYEQIFENLDDNEKDTQSQMFLHYNEAVEIYNSCSAHQIEKLKLPKTESYIKLK